MRSIARSGQMPAQSNRSTAALKLFALRRARRAATPAANNSETSAGKASSPGRRARSDQGRRRRRWLGSVLRRGRGGARCRTDYESRPAGLLAAARRTAATDRMHVHDPPALGRHLPSGLFHHPTPRPGEAWGWTVGLAPDDGGIRIALYAHRDGTAIRVVPVRGFDRDGHGLPDDRLRIVNAERGRNEAVAVDSGAGRQVRVSARVISAVDTPRGVVNPRRRPCLVNLTGAAPRIRRRSRTPPRGQRRARFGGWRSAGRAPARTCRSVGFRRTHELPATNRSPHKDGRPQQRRHATGRKHAVDARRKLPEMLTSGH